MDRFAWLMDNGGVPTWLNFELISTFLSPYFTAINRPKGQEKKPYENQKTPSTLVNNRWVCFFPDKNMKKKGLQISRLPCFNKLRSIGLFLGILVVLESE
ncbi:hypothetical protein L2E82_26934 [Cichorium intybus]|uniref:Uncharacterized protein n=1 Tax=Cichorium intybus TaxID=13427 RepID=A0ACB9CRQ9_CICIN|nr:hypothetical protein L2E82_26934 [Cichorium intybus]